MFRDHVHWKNIPFIQYTWRVINLIRYGNETNTCMQTFNSILYLIILYYII